MTWVCEECVRILFTHDFLGFGSRTVLFIAVIYTCEDAVSPGGIRWDFT